MGYLKKKNYLFVVVVCILFFVTILWEKYLNSFILTAKESTPIIQVHKFENEELIYSTDENELKNQINSFLLEVEPIDKKPIAIIVPHANYLLSGETAAYGFRQLEGYDYDVAIIISSDHFLPRASPIAVWATGVWQTPLGQVAVDEELAQTLVNSDRRITADKSVFVNEHPIAAEIPFLQVVCPKCKIVPIIMGNQFQADVDALSNALVKNLHGRHVIIIASSDLSHFPRSRDADEIDLTVLSAIATLDTRTVRMTTWKLMNSDIPNLSTCACGEAAILVTMQVARELGADSSAILHHTNSSALKDMTENRVTGFGSLMFYKKS